MTYNRSQFSVASLCLCPRTEMQLRKINPLRCPVLGEHPLDADLIIALERWGSIDMTAEPIFARDWPRFMLSCSPTLSLTLYLCREAWINTQKDGHKKFKIQISKVHNIWIIKSVVVGESGSFVKYVFCLGSIVWKVLGL